MVGLAVVNGIMTISGDAPRFGDQAIHVLITWPTNLWIRGKFVSLLLNSNRRLAP